MTEEDRPTGGKGELARRGWRALATRSAALVKRGLAHVARIEEAAASLRAAVIGDIHAAATEGDLEKVRAILAAAPDQVHATDNDRCTPLHRAAWQGHKAVVTLLLANGADAGAKAKDGGAPLYLAAQQGHEDVMMLLLTNGADVDAKAENGRAPLHDAAREGHEDAVALLLDRGADVNAKDKDDWTPLHCAALANDRDVVALLVGAGGNVNARANKGSTPLDFARRDGVRELLKKHGAKG